MGMVVDMLNSQLLRIIESSKLLLLQTQKTSSREVKRFFQNIVAELDALAFLYRLFILLFFFKVFGWALAFSTNFTGFPAIT